jgi:hypothetical protein
LVEFAACKRSTRSNGGDLDEKNHKAARLRSTSRQAAKLSPRIAVGRKVVHVAEESRELHDDDAEWKFVGVSH